MCVCVCVCILYIYIYMYIIYLFLSVVLTLFGSVQGIKLNSSLPFFTDAFNDTKLCLVD